jgi:molybdopterin-guanine dinucleotide biosynthesis protein A
VFPYPTLHDGWEESRGYGFAEAMNPSSKPCAVAILAGGKSRRMGKDKTRLYLGPCTLLGHVKRTAASLGLPVYVVRRDIVPGSGPIGGILTVFHSYPMDSALFLSADMPFVSPSLLRELLKPQPKRTKAVFVKSPHGVGFPFWLQREVCRDVQSCLEKEELSLQRLARRLRPRILRPRSDPTELLNINTPEDLESARQLFARRNASPCWR